MESLSIINGVMGNNGYILLYRDQLEEIKKEIIQNIEKYIDLKLRPLLNYFKKKKDFNEMSFL